MTNTKQKILNYLLSGRSLTVVSCYELFGTPNLRSRIANFKDEGYEIVIKEERTKTARFNRYWIMSKQLTMKLK